MTDTQVPRHADTPEATVVVPTTDGKPAFWYTAAIGGLAFALYLVLLDAAVETLQGQSPVRWWVGSAVAAYLAISISLWRLAPSTWRRVTWESRAAASLFVLLGLLAATAWLPDGMNHGIRMLRQPTSVLLSAVTALAVAVAGLQLMRVRILPLTVKALIGLVAAYGVAAFVLGISTDTAYSSLLHGESAAQRLPLWLQGAFLGALVVIPLALINQFLSAARRIRTRWRWRQVVALGLCQVMVVSGFVTPASVGSTAGNARTSASGLPATLGSGSSLGSTGGQPLSSQERQRLVDQFDREYRAIDRFASAVPGETFDPQAALAKIGRDPDVIFRWVRDQTQWIPYRGVLRGPVGVLMDRMGNDLDRALLLAELLKLSGIGFRLAHGTLSDVQAAGILQVARPRPAADSPVTPDLAPDIKALLSQYAKDNLAEAEKVRQFADDLLQKETHLAGEAAERSATQAQEIAAAIGLVSSKGQPQSTVADLEGLRDHWWVQWHQGSDWTDLDPTMPDAEPGKSMTAASATLAPEALDAALFSEVEIRVITERWEQGHLEETPMLTHVLRPSDMYGIDVSLMHLPIAWPQGFDARHETNLPNRIRDIGLSQHEWLPVLQVGSDIVSQFSFTDAGIKRTARPDTVGMLGTKLERGFEGVFGAFGGPDDQKPRTILTAEWIEYEIQSPGKPARRIRRQLFDSIGPAQRTAAAPAEPTMTDSLHRSLALTLLGKTDILILGCQPSRDFVAHLLAQRLLHDRQPLLKVASTEPHDEEALQAALADMTPLPGPLYGLAMARSRWSRYRNNVYTDRPIILSAHQQIREGPDGDLGAYSFDIVANDVAVGTDSNIDAPLVRLEQGVVDTAAESLFASAFLETGENGQTTSSVSEIFRLARGQGVDWSAIRSVDDPAWQRIQLSADARTRINQDLAAGYVVVTPNRPVMLNGRSRVGWWRVDPKSGQSLGVDDQGWGQSMVEWARLLVLGVSTGVCLARAARRNGPMRGLETSVCLLAGGFSALGLYTGIGEWSLLGQFVGLGAGLGTLMQ